MRHICSALVISDAKQLKKNEDYFVVHIEQRLHVVVVKLLRGDRSDRVVGLGFVVIVPGERFVGDSQTDPDYAVNVAHLPFNRALDVPFAAPALYQFSQDFSVLPQLKITELSCEKRAQKSPTLLLRIWFILALDSQLNVSGKHFLGISPCLVIMFTSMSHWPPSLIGS